jgi:hypothetical protein
MVRLTMADQNKLEAKKTIKIKPLSYKSVDFYETDILGKVSNNSKSNSEKQKPDTQTANADQRYDPEFHEQFFS